MLLEMHPDGVTRGYAGVFTVALLDKESGLWVAEVHGRSEAECRERATTIITALEAQRVVP